MYIFASSNFLGGNGQMNKKDVLKGATGVLNGIGVSLMTNHLLRDYIHIVARSDGGFNATELRYSPKNPIAKVAIIMAKAGLDALLTEKINNYYFEKIDDIWNFIKAKEVTVDEVQNS